MIFRMIVILLTSAACSFAADFSERNTAINFDTIELQPLKVSCSDSWIGRDKVHHFLTSAFLAAGSYYFLYEENAMAPKDAMIFSIGFSLSLGVAKEVRDGVIKGRSASIKDFIANILGAGFGGLIYNAN